MPKWGMSWHGMWHWALLMGYERVRLFWEATGSRREGTTNSGLMEACWLEELGSISPLLPIDTVLCKRKET